MSLYDKRANKYDSDFQQAPIRAIVKDCISGMIAENISLLTSASIIDVGAGHGHLWEHFQPPQMKKLALVDASEKMLQHAKQRLKSIQTSVSFHQFDFTNLSDFEDNSFDLYISTFALHHIPDEEKKLALMEAKRVLRPNGKIIIADEIIANPALFNQP